ncbi:MAG: SUMF1/EgtB/PvdO family nonheme iron enzyme [bacterium]
MAELVTHFNVDWWEETLRFFMALSDDKLFDDFMRALFKAPFSRELDQRGQNLLATLTQEAPQKRLDALSACLRDQRVHPNRHHYALECLKLIGSPESRKLVAEYLERSLIEERRKHEAGIREHSEEVAPEMPARNLDFAKEILAYSRFIAQPMADDRYLYQTLLRSFRNSFEENTEYILIPGGEFKYSVTEKIETLPNIYFAKYPVTNKRYRRFVAYLAGEDTEFEQILPQKKFVESLFAFANEIEGFGDYLGEDSSNWQDKMRSEEDGNKRFNHDDQPVVGIS